MRTVKRIIAVTLILSVVLALAACGKKPLKECTWDGYNFKVEYVKTVDSEEKTSKVVRLKLIMDKDGMPVDVFEKNVEAGNILVKDAEPSKFYLYTKNKKGDVTSVNLSFFLPNDYVFDENDLVVKE